MSDAFFKMFVSSPDAEKYTWLELERRNVVIREPKMHEWKSVHICFEFREERGSWLSCLNHPRSI